MIYNQRNTHQWITWTKTKPSKQFRRKTLNFFAWFPRSSRKFDMTRTKSMRVKSIFIWKSRNRQTKRGRNTTLVQLSEKLKKNWKKNNSIIHRKRSKTKNFQILFYFSRIFLQEPKRFQLYPNVKKKQNSRGGPEWSSHLQRNNFSSLTPWISLKFLIISFVKQNPTRIYLQLH